jgi:hypothetical protein
VAAAAAHRRQDQLNDGDHQNGLIVRPAERRTALAGRPRNIIKANDLLHSRPCKRRAATMETHTHTHSLRCHLGGPKSRPESSQPAGLSACLLSSADGAGLHRVSPLCRKIGRPFAAASI